MYAKWQKAWEKHIDFILLDLLCMMAAFYLGYLWRHGVGMLDGYSSLLYWRLIGILILVDICVMFLGDSYKGIVRRGYLTEFKQTFRHCITVDFIILLYLFLTKQTGGYSRETLLVFGVLQLVMTYIVRCLRKHAVRIRMLHNAYVEQMLILTDEKHAKSCIAKLTGDKFRNYRVVGVVMLDEFPEKSVNGQDITRQHTEVGVFGKEAAVSAEQSGIFENKTVVFAERSGAFAEEIDISAEKTAAVGFRQLSDYLLNHVVDSVFVNVSLDEKDMDRLLQVLINSGVVVHINLSELSHSSPNSTVEQIGDFTVMTAGMRIATTRQCFLKRSMDILGGIAGCVITLFVALFLTPVIYLQSPGPIFFSQERVGKNGRIFKIYKFRSMYVDAEERKKELLAKNQMDGLMFKIKDDPRITPVGHFLRRYSIDELPQFFNVLRGEMSLVGTRPPTLDEFEKYQLHHRGRLGFRPGITGLWQVSGRNHITDFERVVELDTEYIMNWSISEDIRILWKTVKQMVKGDGR